MATKTVLTVDDFVRMPKSVNGQDVRYELVEGELARTFPTIPLHNRVRGKLERRLAEIAEQHGL